MEALEKYYLSLGLSDDKLFRHPSESVRREDLKRLAELDYKKKLENLKEKELKQQKNKVIKELDATVVKTDVMYDGSIDDYKNHCFYLMYNDKYFANYKTTHPYERKGVKDGFSVKISGKKYDNYHLLQRRMDLFCNKCFESTPVYVRLIDGVTSIDKCPNCI